jgi:ribonuclease P protein subunit RPR2
MVDSRKKLIKSSVRQSIAQLLSEADGAWKTGKKERSKRYAEMAMGLVKKHKVRLTDEQKRRFCRKCYSWWIPGDTVKLIFDKRHNVIRMKCAKCGYTRRL